MSSVDQVQISEIKHTLVQIICGSPSDYVSENDYQTSNCFTLTTHLKKMIVRLV